MNPNWGQTKMSSKPISNAKDGCIYLIVRSLTLPDSLEHPHPILWLGVGACLHFFGEFWETIRRCLGNLGHEMLSWPKKDPLQPGRCWDVERKRLCTTP